MNPLDAFAPPSIRPRTAAVPPASSPRGPGPAPASDGPRRGRAAAAVSLASGLLAVVAAALGSVLLFSLTPLFLVAVLGPAALAAGVVALVRSRARGSDVVLLSAGGAASALVAGVVATTTLFPVGPPDLADAVAATEVDAAAEAVPADLLAAMDADATPLGTTRQMEGGDVAVVDVRTDPDDVADRLEGMDWLRQDVREFPDLVLVELEAPLEDGSWVPVVDQGDVSLVTADGRTYQSWRPGRSASYEVETVLESSGGGRGRGLVVVAVAMPHADAVDAFVVVTSPSWTDVAAWEATAR